MRIYLPIIFILLIFGCSAQEVELEKFVSAEGKFSILFPGKPTQETRIINTDSGQIKINFYSVDLDDKAYSVSYFDYPEEFFLNTTEDEILDAARDGAVENTFGLLKTEEIISVDGYPGRKLKIAVGEKQTYISQIVLVNHRMYSIGIVIPNDQVYTSRISDVTESFKLL